MSRQINQPINQVKLTNVAVVRCNKGGKRFEIACYRNKVMDYRAGLEKDMSEVLQTDRIFTNVSKGQFAKVADLQKAFGTDDQEEIAKIILEQSDKQQSHMQVSDLERAQSIKDTLSQIATWVAANCVHADGSDRPFTPSQIRHALAKCYTAHPNKPVKKQCLDAVKFLRTVIPIERAKMEIQMQYSPDQEDVVESTLHAQSHKVIRRSTSDTVNTLVVQVDPSMYRDLSEIISKTDGSLEILEQVIMSKHGDMDLEQQWDNKNRLEMLTPQEQSNCTKNDKETAEVDIVDPDEQDSDVEDLVEKLQTIRTGGIPGVDNGHNESRRDNDGNDSESDGMPLSRKDQKKHNKKSKKAKRREHEDEEYRLEQLTDSEKRRLQGAQTRHSEGNGATTAVTLLSSQTNGGANGDVKSCNTCGGSFVNMAEYRAHYKSDWHRFNQKLKLKGIPAVTQEEFLLCDADSFFNNNT